MSIYVTRPAGGITLNAGIRETLLDSDGKPMTFKDEDQAIAYLFAQGAVIDEDDLLDFEFPVVCPICTNPLEDDGECLLCGKYPLENLA